MNEVAINVEELVKVYKLYEKPIDRLKESLSITKHKYHTEYYALNGLSLQVKKGETIAIIGINGAGKSTLLKILTGVLSPTSGKVSVNGNVSALLELGTGFNPEYTGIENIYLNGTMRGFSRESIDTKLKKIVEFADIGDFIYQPVKTYSSGMFARLAFAVAINVEPEILIVDEALSVGDIFFQQKCNQYMKDNMNGITKIIVTHDMNSVSNMADRVIVLEKGKIIFDGETGAGIECYLKRMHNTIFKSENTVQIEEKNMDLQEGWIPVDSGQLGGAQEVKILEACMLINNEMVNIVKPGDKVEMFIKLKSNHFTNDLIIGYTYKDKYGNSIFAQNTIGQGILIDEINADKVYIAKIQIYWPQVKEGDYFLTIGIGEGEDPMVHKIQCWAHNVFHVEAITNIPMHGIFNHEIDEFDVQRA